MDDKTCLSCKLKVINDSGTAVFQCPQCIQYEIIRCSHCRRNATKYSCPACGFVGPN